MKKITKTLVAAAIVAAFGLGTKPAQAQVGNQATLTLAVTDILVLAVSTPIVNLNMASLTDYQNGNSYVATAHLLTSSNRSFDISVRSDGNLEGLLTNAGSSIPIQNVSVQAAPTTTTTYTQSLPLSSSDQVLVASAPAGMAKAYDVKYTLAGGSSFLVKGGAYKATLTYSIAAKWVSLV